jgi:chemotaxis protein MotB
MRTNLWRFIVGALVAVFMVACGPSRREHQETLSDLTAKEEQLEEKEKRIEYLETELRKVTARLADEPEVIEKIKVERVAGTIRFTILNEVLFGKGSFTLQGEGLAALDHLAGLIGEKYPDRHVIIEGHTDNQPYQDPSEFSNWDLSSERALSVLDYLVERGISPDRLSIAAYAQYRPVADNSTEEGRRKNRRAVIVVQPEESEVERARVAGEDVPDASPEKETE